MRTEYVTESEARIDWAEAAMTLVDELIDRYLCSDPVDAIRHVSRSGNEAHIRYERSVNAPPPIQLRFAVGDVIHNIRSTADNLIWGLGQEYGWDEKLGLTFGTKKKQFEKNVLPNYLCLPANVVKWIVSIQPFTTAPKPHPAASKSLLYVLHELWNRDKHRAPTLVVASEHTELPKDPSFIEIVHPLGDASNNAEILTAKTRWDEHEQFNLTFNHFVAFDQLNIAGSLEEVAGVLRHQIAYFRKTVIPLIDSARPK